MRPTSHVSPRAPKSGEKLSTRRATVPGLNLRLPPLPALRAVLVVFLDALAFGDLPPADFFADAFVRAILAAVGCRGNGWK